MPCKLPLQSLGRNVPPCVHRIEWDLVLLYFLRSKETATNPHPSSPQFTPRSLQHRGSSPPGLVHVGTALSLPQPALSASPVQCCGHLPVLWAQRCSISFLCPCQLNVNKRNARPFFLELGVQDTEQIQQSGKKLHQ